MIDKSKPYTKWIQSGAATKYDVSPSPNLIDKLKIPRTSLCLLGWMRDWLLNQLWSYFDTWALYHSICALHDLRRSREWRITLSPDQFELLSLLHIVSPGVLSGAQPSM